jgi:hypothetical protein
VRVGGREKERRDDRRKGERREKVGGRNSEPSGTCPPRPRGFHRPTVPPAENPVTLQPPAPAAAPAREAAWPGRVPAESGPGPGARRRSGEGTRRRRRRRRRWRRRRRRQRRHRRVRGRGRSIWFVCDCLSVFVCVRVCARACVHACAIMHNLSQSCSIICLFSGPRLSCTAELHAIFFFQETKQSI